MVFKSGPLGIGYYCDIPDACKNEETSLPALRGDFSELEYLAPLVSAAAAWRGGTRRMLLLADLLVFDDGGDRVGGARSRAPRQVKRARGRRRRGRKPISGDWCPQTLLGVPKADISHWEHGAWAFDTYNGNTMGTAHAYLEQSGADVCFIQESRVAGDRRLAAERRAALAKWSLALEPGKPTEARQF